MIEAKRQAKKQEQDDREMEEIKKARKAKLDYYKKNK